MHLAARKRHTGCAGHRIVRCTTAAAATTTPPPLRRHTARAREHYNCVVCISRRLLSVGGACAEERDGERRGAGRLGGRRFGGGSGGTGGGSADYVRWSLSSERSNYCYSDCTVHITRHAIAPDSDSFSPPAVATAGAHPPARSNSRCLTRALSPRPGSGGPA